MALSTRLSLPVAVGLALIACASAVPAASARTQAPKLLTTAGTLTLTTDVASTGASLRWRVTKGCAGKTSVRLSAGSRQLGSVKAPGARSTTSRVRWSGQPLAARTRLTARIAPGAARSCVIDVATIRLTAAGPEGPGLRALPSAASEPVLPAPSPEAAPAPSASAPPAAPAPMVAPEPTDTPEPTDPTDPTQTPDPTDTPEPTQTPDPINTPEPTDASESAFAVGRTPRWFAPDSVWNKPTPADARIDPSSDRWVRTLRTAALAGPYDPWIEARSYSTPVYEVGAAQRRSKVIVDQKFPLRLHDQFASVPIPDDAVPASASDGHLVVYQPSTDTMWEFWKARKAADGWHARYGGRIERFSASPGYYEGDDRLLGATATSLPLLGGLMRIDELRAQKIDHALALAIPAPAARVVFPAQRGDGKDLSPDAIPSGTRFRVDPKLDVEALPVSGVTKAIIRAAQRYGMIVRDRTATSVNLYGEMSKGGPDPYARPDGVFGKQWPSQIMRSFPWDHLQVVAP